MNQQQCPDCGYSFRNKIVRIESDDDALWEHSGLYCPRCLLTTLLPRVAELDAMLDEVAGCSGCNAQCAAQRFAAAVV